MMIRPLFLLPLFLFTATITTSTRAFQVTVQPSKLLVTVDRQVVESHCRLAVVQPVLGGTEPSPHISEPRRSSSTSTCLDSMSTTTLTEPSKQEKEEKLSERGGSVVGAKLDETLFNFNKFVIDSVYHLICLLYPVSGGKRDYARFYVLETVARVPYFAYLSVLHLRETLGERDLGDKMRTHYAEADNELHHLLIMEDLGGNDNPLDRAVAQSMACVYYWYVVAVYCFSESAAYHLSELIEDHAYETYDQFLTNHEAMLKSKPVPVIAQKYYVEDNPFMFDLCCTVPEERDPQSGNLNQHRRRPHKLESLYDVFVNIRDDEKEHWKTLCNLVQYNTMGGVQDGQVRSTQPLIYSS